MSANRRLAAILAADVVGYSRLMGEDEAGTARAVREHREAATPIVTSHGGRIVKTMGDGVLLEFPSVVAAVECAVAIQKLMVERNAGTPEDRRILYRIGVHVGDVLIEDDDILGDGVNIAARLEGIAKPGGICLSEDAYRQVRDKVKDTFVDLGERELKNIARPVRVYAVGIGAGSAALAPSALASQQSGPPRLSIVVLPFANIGGDPEQEYFVDGVTESLTTDLSRVRGSYVVGRHTAFTYKGKAIDLKQIGRELNVRYVLEGSVQRGGNRMRVNVQLIDAESGNHLWAERFDKPLVDLFDLQDEIVARLANALSTELTAAEARRAERAPNPDSMDLYFQGLALLNRRPRAETVAHARDFCERALVLDPLNVDALVGLAAGNIWDVTTYASDNRSARVGAAEAALTKALSLAPDHALAHMRMGQLQIYTNRAFQGISECERALALDRNLAAAHGFIAVAKLMIGRPEETEAHVRDALRLSPGDSGVYLWIHIVGAASLHLGSDEKAVEWLHRAIETNRNLAITHFYLAAALALLGRLDEARISVQTGLSLNPTFTVSRYRAGASTNNPTYLAQRERACEGMRKAGVPEA